MVGRAQCQKVRTLRLPNAAEEPELGQVVGALRLPRSEQKPPEPIRPIRDPNEPELEASNAREGIRNKPPPNEKHENLHTAWTESPAKANVV